MEAEFTEGKGIEGELTSALDCGFEYTETIEGESANGHRFSMSLFASPGEPPTYWVGNRVSGRKTQSLVLCHDMRRTARRRRRGPVGLLGSFIKDLVWQGSFCRGSGSP